MQSHSPTHHVLIVLAILTAAALGAPPCYGSTSAILYDGDGFRYDVSTGSGTCISEGTADSYDNAYYLRINGVNYNATNLTISGRNIVGTTETVAGLRVARKLYVPQTKDGTLGNFGRWYDSLYNPTGSPITVSVEYFSNLGSDGATQITGTDDDDRIIELTDQWVSTDDESDGGGDSSLAHVVYVTGADQPIDYIELYGTTYDDDRLAWRYDNVTVNPGETIAFLTFAVQENNRSNSMQEARGIIAALETGNFGSVALRGLSVGEYMYLVNLTPIPPDDLQISPWDDSISAGNEGGPFEPAGLVYTLSNTGLDAINWAVEPNVPWLEVSPSTGNLLPGADTDVTVYVNANANILPQGIHTGPVSFTNLSSGALQKRYVRLMVGIRRVLVYSQFADMSTGGEYDNTIKAIDSTGTNFAVTDLTDYTELDSMLPGHQILLVPEQERASLTQLFDIGKEWAPILQDFVSTGGAVIQCDYDQKYGILTGAGLMNITTSSDFSRQSVYVVAPDSPITQGVASPYTAGRYSSHYYTTDGKPVVERAGYGPVVIHKMIGRGHVVLIGHDYFESNPDQDRIVGNAVLYLPFLTDDLWVAPSQGLDFVGNKGGPFTPASRSYTITNIGADPLEWNATIAQPWLSVEPNSGTLDPTGSVGGGDSQAISISITDANFLPPGDYNDVITFTNVTTGHSEIRVVRLQVIPIPPEIEVIDGIGLPLDLYMPFGDLIVGQTFSLGIKIMNTSPDNNLLISDISATQVLSKGFFDDFRSTILNPDNWTATAGEPTIDDIGFGEPSMPHSLHLSGDSFVADAVESSEIDLSGLSGLEFRYSWQRTGGGERPPDGNDLVIDYWDGTSWVELDRQYGGGSDMTEYVESAVALPFRAYHEDFKLRIRHAGKYHPYRKYGDWFVDDVSVRLPAFRLESMPDLPIVIPPVGYVDFNAVFMPTEVKDYEGGILIASNDDDEPESVVLLTGRGIPDYLAAEPEEEVEFSGHLGGPFLPSNMPYHLTNQGPIAVAWSVELDAPWLDASPAGGSIAPGESATVFVTPNSQADIMPAGQHIGRLIFTDLTTTVQHKRTVVLNVEAKPKVWVRPRSLNVIIPSGELQTHKLTVGNLGNGDLECVLRGREINRTRLCKSEPNAHLTGEADGVPAAGESGPEPELRLDIPHAEGRLFVRFVLPEDDGEPNVILEELLTGALAGASIEQEYSLVPGLCLIRLPQGMTAAEAMTVLGCNDDVSYVEPDYKIEALSVIPNDSYFSQLWNMHNTGQTGGTADADIDAPEAWGLIEGGLREVIVAVLDTGVDYRHLDLAANMWINRAEFTGAPGVDDDRNGYVDDVYGYDFANRDGDPIDDNGHGSHVSGIIGAVANNARGVTGICWNVKIMAVKFLNSGRTGYASDAVYSIQYATRMGAKVISNSWGSNGYNSALEDAIRQAGQAGVLFVTAAGDGTGRDNDVNPHYPSGYELENVISVLSTDLNDRLSGHSSYGLTSVDLGAPGGDSSNQIRSCNRNGGYTWMHGTSMAAAHVSGACAAVWSASPVLSHTEVKDLIMQTVDQLPSLNGYCVSGGRLNLQNAIRQTRAAWMDIIPDTGVVRPGEVLDVNVVFDANLPAGTYEGQIIAYTNDPFTPELFIAVTMTVEQVDYFTELFDFEYPFDPCESNRNDMANRTLTLVPDGSGSYYQACSVESAGFHVDPGDGTSISLRDDDYAQIDLVGNQIDFYGKNYETFYIGSNGYVTFGSGDAHGLESLEDHFDLPRISALFDDLDPSAGGRISWQQLDDRVVVTFEGVPEFSLSNYNSFQLEMFYNGKLRITYLDIAADDGLIGLSDGYGCPLYFIESDLSEYCLVGDLDGDCDSDFADYALLTSCWKAADCGPGNDWCSGIDLDRNGTINICDCAEFSARWLEGTEPKHR